MNTEKINVVFAYIGIVLIVVLLSGMTYAFLNNGEITEEEENKLNDNIIVEYIDTSNVSMVNFKPGEEIIKTFSVINNGDNIEYYDINLENVANNFNDLNDLIYSLESDGGAYVYLNKAPISSVSIASNIKIAPQEKHMYTFKIMFKKLDIDQSINLNKTFSSNIKVVSTKNIISYDKGSIGYEIVNNTISVFKNNDENIYEDGVYYTNNSINGKTVYFYRGSSNLNNNVIFGNNCYKIIRTTEDGGIRIIYNGKVKEGKCSSDENVLEELNEFNLRSNFNAYVGYMYGNASSNNYESEHRNINSSAIKIVLDSWYTSNIADFNDFISQNTIYCNNRNLGSFTLNNVLYDKIGYGNNTTGYELMSNYLNNEVSYNCSNLNDRFSVNSEFGNDILTNSVGLITLEELFYAGYSFEKNNIDNYLYSNIPYWTMSSAYFSSNNAYNFIVNKDRVSVLEVNKKIGVRPVITLNKDTIILKGDGSLDNPYILFRRIL